MRSTESERARRGGELETTLAEDIGATTCPFCHDVLRQSVARGSSRAVLGNPATAVAWLARKLAGFGVALEAGHVILPGSCTRAFDVHPGSCVRAHFDGLGPVEVHFD